MLKLSQVMFMSGQIVFRLRLAFLCILLTLILAGSIGGYQLTSLASSQETAIKRAVPSLVTAHELQSELANMLQIREQLRQADSVEQVTRLEDSLRRLIRSLLDRTGGQSTDLATPSSSLDSIGLGLKVLEQLLVDSVPLRLKLIRGLENLDQQRQTLSSLRTKFRFRVEPRLIEAAFVLDEALGQSAALSVEDRSSIAIQIGSQQSLSELSFMVMAAIDLAEQLTPRNGASLLAEGAADLQFRLRNVAQLLVTLDDDPFRRQVAVILRELHEQILGDQGLVKELAAIEELQKSLAGFLIDQGAVVQSVSQSVDGLVVAAREEIDVSSEAFSNALRQTIVLLLLAVLLIISVIVCVSYYIVERQIGRRMVRLTSAVLDIAGGDTQRIVKVRGDDEIGRMASALEVFKSNARELRETSADMEQFVYAAAHDLRSPLRVIESLAQWTIEDGEDLPADCMDNLQKILQRTRRLSALQSDLLDYSRAGQASDGLVNVDLASMIRELSELLDPEDSYSIQAIGNMPVVNTYATPLRQVLLNLLTNAIKHHDKDKGKVEIRAKFTDDRMSLSVQDDGGGIEPCFQAQIFELFKTLQPKDVVEGSGLGLSLIQKLVTRYDGKVGVVSNPDVARGATFFFDWPIQDGPLLNGEGGMRSGSQLACEQGGASASSSSTGRYSKESTTERKTDDNSDVPWKNAS